MNVELKNIREAGGEETPRFEATVYVDGKRRGIVANGGTGGCCNWSDERLRREVAEYARANGYDGFEPEDGLIYRLLDDAAIDKAIKRDLSDKLMFRVEGEDSIRQMNRRRFPEEACRNTVARKYGAGVTILNDLPFEEVRRHYEECGLIQ